MSDDINSYVPSLLKPRTIAKNGGNSTFLTQNSIVSRCSLSLKRNGRNNTPNIQVPKLDNKENIPPQNGFTSNRKPRNKSESIIFGSIGNSVIEDLIEVRTYQNLPSEPASISEIFVKETKENLDCKKRPESLLSVSSATELYDISNSSDSIEEETHQPSFNLQIGINNCHNIEFSTKNVSVNKFTVNCENDCMIIDCNLQENSLNTSSVIEEMSQHKDNPLKRSATTVNIEIKKKKSDDDLTADSVLILNTNTIEKVSHVIVQPPNYKSVNNKIDEKSKINGKPLIAVPGQRVYDGKRTQKNNDILKQKSIVSYFRNNPVDSPRSSQTNEVGDKQSVNVFTNETGEMNKNFPIQDSTKSDQFGRSGIRLRNELNLSPRCTRVYATKNESVHSRKEVKSATSELHGSSSPVSKFSCCMHSPKKNTESMHFALSSRKSSKLGTSKNVPHHKIVAGTRFAVDAFSYGDIPNIKYYFLTHFHSDHYCGLKKSFSKMLYCSKITADLCTSRLGVNPKCIQVMNLDETIRLDGVEITSVDANHCPGAIMLVFTLPNGKSILHTGDFRASPAMESYPLFWNKEIHTIYLDTTYCNPRYDFPTQDESLDMALYHLRQKKMAVEKAGKKFSSVLIVCGTYTIGKEKFFLGMSERVGCGVWACADKARVLAAAGAGGGAGVRGTDPRRAQIHVLPMRDLSYESLRAYLDSMQGVFSEVVAFKPSGWETEKNTIVEKDSVTIHGIPYSEHSSFSELIRFVKFLKPKLVIPTVDIAGGVKAVQKHFPCPLVYKEDVHQQSKVTDFFRIQDTQPGSAVT